MNQPLKKPYRFLPAQQCAGATEELFERFLSPLQPNLKSITNFLFVRQLSLHASCITQGTSLTALLDAMNLSAVGLSAQHTMTQICA